MVGKPLAGIRVVEMSHMVMGPSCGLILSQLGAEVIKVEPPGGDKTRSLRGMGAGFFPVFSRGKRSVTIDLQGDAGQRAMSALLDSADVFIENFRDSTIEKMGLDAAMLKTKFPKLIIASHKGFLSGPYETRPALDEVVQMQSGLAYMTGSRERPLRTGASVNDIMGGLFGALAVVTMLLSRERSGEGGSVRVGLFENSLFLMAQHIAQFQLTRIPVKPMSMREHAWPVYDIFATRDGVHIFIAVTTDDAWKRFCVEFGLGNLLDDPELGTTSNRIERRHLFLPIVAGKIAELDVSHLETRLERLGLPFARVNSPEDVLQDAHVHRDGGLATVRNTDGNSLLVPTLPLEFENAAFSEPQGVSSIGFDNEEILTGLGFTPAQIAEISGANAIV